MLYVRCFTRMVCMISDQGDKEMADYVKTAIAVVIAACMVLGALLLGYSRHRREAPSDSIHRLGATTPTAKSSTTSLHFELLRELCARTGIDAPTEGDVLRDGGAHRVLLASGALQEPAGEERHADRASDACIPSAYEVNEAVQFALEVAARDDDYAAMGVEHEADDEPRKIELTLLDIQQRDRVELFSKLIANARDILAEDRFAQQRGILKTLIEDLSVCRDEAMAAMSMRATIDMAEVGTRRDRQVCDFYFAVANHLRSHGYLKQLSRKGVAGTTDSAIFFELPDILEALKAEAPEVALLKPSDLHRLLDMESHKARHVVPSLLQGNRAMLRGPEA